MSAGKPVVHVVDDDDAVRDSLAFLLSSAGISASPFESGLAFLKEVPSAGIVLTDLRMPGMDGMELLKRLNADGHRLPVVLMTGHGEVALAVEAMKLGAIDFIEKPFDDEALLAAVRSAISKIDGEPVDAETRAFTQRLETLSGRERQVFDHLILGGANKVIARALEISPRTVEIYRANVMTKLAASNLPELVRAAVRAGIL